MDKEASKTNKQNKNKATSKDVESNKQHRVASQDGSRCKAPVTRHFDAPVSHKDAPIPAASSESKERESTGDKPNRAAPRTVPNPTETTKPLHREASSVAARLTASVEPKEVTLDDAAVLYASEGVTSTVRPMRNTVSETVNVPGAASSTMDMTALKTAIQEPTMTMVLSSSKRRRLNRVRRAAERQELLAAAQGPPVNPKPAPGASRATGGRRWEPKPTASNAALRPDGSKCSTRPENSKKPKTNEREKGQKRVRPEDSVTPTGERKRVKPNRPRTVGGTSASYAEAAAAYKTNEFCVAVMTEPFLDMTQEQAEAIRLQIQGKLHDELLADFAAPLTEETKDIRFRGKAHFADGVLKMWCEDAYALRWLTSTCDAITNPITDTKLVVRPQSAIPSKVPCLLHVPDYSDSTENLMRLILRQNRHYNIRSWTLTHERRTKDPTGVSLFFRVPESEIVTIKKQDRRVYYLLGNIYIRILDKDEPSQVADAPPQAISSTSGTVTPRPTPSTSLTEKAADGRATKTHVPMETAQLTSDEELFQETGGSELSDSCLRSSPPPN
ncbi:uncharacterized protein LOC125059307 [Pieris napi]|uniref:uncharacterized protein LOC125059307 n=1 Tax=Pieris napi TaxID=78633 RepID=UPI001FB98786|nr:uncharacterized protein LOC125059307 [Pieris napi]XP_047519638.1 uncharacterized protein LOC125059307 [Pieris napi]